MLTALAAHRGFVVYRLARLPNGKTDKIPFNPLTGYDSNAQDQTTWMTPDVATAQAAAWSKHFPQGTGVGIVIYEGSQLFCVDVDGAVTDGIPSEFAQSIMDRFPGAYMELSQSKAGLHIFGFYRGILPPHKTKNIHKHIELYTKLRFIALTDYTLGGHVGTDCTDVLTAFAQEYFPKADGDYEGEWTTEPCKGWDFLTDDDALLQWAATYADRNVKFQNKPSPALLMSGSDELGKWFPSQTGNAYDASSVDQAMANFFAYATGNNCERVRALMLRTGLRRDKWDREDYFHRTIARACTAHGPFPKLASVAQPTVPQGPAPNPVPQAPQSAQVPQAPGVVPQYVPQAPQAPAAAPPVPEAMPGADGVIGRGGNLFTHDQQRVFAGLTYVEDVHMIMMPDGILLDQKRFDVREPYAGRYFQMTMDGSEPGQSAWKAFTEGLTIYPKVRGQYFEPREAPGSIMTRDGQRFVNSWQPVEIDATPGNYQWFLDHVAKILPVGEDAHILVQFMKFMVQHKGEKAAWFPFIQGVEGNGKSFINETMQYCLSERYTHKPRPNELAGRFNAPFYGKLFIAIDDIQLADARHIWETLKPMVDGKKLEIEYKGVDKVSREVCFNMIATSNFKDGIPVTANDRRVAPFFCAQQIEADLVRDGMDSDYFTKLWATAKAGGWAAVLHWLGTDAIDQRFSPVGDAIRAPRTSSTFAAKAVTMGSVEQEVLEAVDVNREGFKGGWISSAAFDSMLKMLGKDKVLSLNKRSALLGTLGYIQHPGLTDGRVSTPLTDGTKPRLYIKPSHPLAGLVDKAQIRDAFINAQAVK